MDLVLQAKEQTLAESGKPAECLVIANHHPSRCRASAEGSSMSTHIAQGTYTSTQNIGNGKSLTMEMQAYGEPDSPLRSTDSQHRLNFSPTPHSNAYPSELEKTALCFVLMSVILVLNIISTAIIHDRTPNEKMKHPPLRDISFDASSSINEGDTSMILTISEILLVISSGIVFGLITLHRHKSIIFRRFFFLIFLLFSARLLTMNATMLPISSERLYHCEPKHHAANVGLIMSRFLEISYGWGLSSTSELKYCGNYVYSGHTVVLVLNSLMIDEYCPSFLVNVLMKVITLISVLMILVSRYDYTVSVIIAYYITTRLFWLYHTLANNPPLKKLNATNQICKEWWYPIFQFLEGNVKDVVPPSFKFLR